MTHQTKDILCLPEHHQLLDHTSTSVGHRGIYETMSIRLLKPYKQYFSIEKYVLKQKWP